MPTQVRMWLERGVERVHVRWMGWRLPASSDSLALQDIWILPLIFMAFISFSLLLRSAEAAPHTQENAKWNVNFNRDGADPSKYFGKWPGHEYFPSPDDWRKIGIYHLLTDRFRDGDPTNNDGKYGGFNALSLGMRQGGDFKGIIERLDYIKALGFDAILISPIFQNDTNFYHGYGQLDFTLLDDRFGTLEEFRTLVKELHRREMYMIVDIVVNHMGNLLYAEGFQYAQPPFRLHSGEYQLFYRDSARKYSDFTVVNQFSEEGQYPNVYDKQGGLVVDKGKGSFWKSDFHHNGALTDFNDPWNIHLGKIFNYLDDLRTTHPRVQDKIIAMTRALISSTDIDAIRMDTPMQVPASFFERWAPAVREHAKALGKDNFFIFGEFYVEPRMAATLIGRGQTPETFKEQGVFIRDEFALDAGIDYDTYKMFLLPALLHLDKAPLTQGVDRFQRMNAYYDLAHPVLHKDRHRMLHFFNNHDQRRLATFPAGRERNRLATALIAFWPGIPLFYYGDEQGICSYGSGLEGHARDAMMASIAWKDHPSCDGEQASSKDNFDMLHSDYTWVQRLMELRKSYPALYRGDKIEIALEKEATDGSVFAFTRSTEEGESALILVNTSSEVHSDIDLSTAWREGTDVANLLGQTSGWKVSGAKRLQIAEVAPYSVMVFVPEKQRVSTRGRVTSSFPAHDALIDQDLVKILITFDRPMDAASVKQSLVYNGVPVISKLVRYDKEKQTLKYAALAYEGVNTIEISGDARDATGNPLAHLFHSRFRRASARNPLRSQEILVDKDLLNGGHRFAFSSKVKISHAARGAEYFRFSSNDGKNWSEWQPYKESSELTFPHVHGWQEVLVQYWIDGSAAYFVRDGIDHYVFDGSGYEWDKRENMQTLR